MGMKSMYDLRDMLCKELDEISRKGELGAGDLDIVHKLASTIKNLDKIEAMEDLFRAYGIKEIARTGKIALLRGAHDEAR